MTTRQVAFLEATGCSVCSGEQRQLSFTPWSDWTTWQTFRRTFFVPKLAESLTTEPDFRRGTQLSSFDMLLHMNSLRVMMEVPSMSREIT